MSKSLPNSLSCSKKSLNCSLLSVYLMRCKTSKNGYVTGENMASIKCERRKQFFGERWYDRKNLIQKFFSLDSLMNIVIKT